LVTAQLKVRRCKISFSSVYTRNVKIPSSRRHGKKDFKGSREEEKKKRISPLPLESYSGIQDIVSPSDYNCNVLECTE